MVRALILALMRRAGPRNFVKVVTFEKRFEFRRWCPFWPDEYVTKAGTHYDRPPWWRPFNVLLHWWCPDKDAHEPFHDHPRWSVTICLRGCIVEETPWKKRYLWPGAVVIRSRRAIHRFYVPESFPGKTWTLFIVGRRDYRQSTYIVTPR